MSGPVWRIDLRRVARLAWADRRWLLRVNGLVAVSTVAIVLLLPRWYASSVTLVPAPREGVSLELGGGAVAASGASLLVGGQPTPQDQLRMVVASRAVGDSLVHAFDLRSRWKLRRLEQARRRLARHTTLTTPRDGQVTVTVESTSPVLARDLAAAYASHAARASVGLRTSLAAQRRAYLQTRLAELEGSLVSVADRVRAFEERHRAVSPPDQVRAALDAVGHLHAELGRVEGELAAVRRYFTERSPEVRTLADRAGALRSQLLELRSGRAHARGPALPALQQEYQALAREQASLIAVAELVRRIYEQARVEESNPVPAFSVLDAAEIPERHSRPARGLTVAITVALSAGASVLMLERRARQRGGLSRAGTADAVAAEAA